jgi:Chaperone of endosialidase
MAGQSRVNQNANSEFEGRFRIMSTESRGEQRQFSTGNRRWSQSGDALSVLTLLRFAKCLSAGFLGLVVICLSLATAEAQQTAFTYQGRLTDGGNVASGNYDLQFALFDSSTSGAQISTTQTLASVSVSAGVFTVSLDFGANAFNGANRYLEISARPSGSGSFVTLSPRQPISSTPYAVKSVSAVSAMTADGLSQSCVGCVTSAHILSVQGSQVTGAVAGSQINGTIPVASVPPGSASYIQNGMAEQASSNFNISGDGTAGGKLSARFVSATSSLSIGGSTVLRAPTDNLFLGVAAGNVNNGQGNSVIGFSAATDIFPESRRNTFLGYESGFLNPIHGSDNTLLGANTRVNESGTPIFNATAIGVNASVAQSNSMVLGSGVNVGIGVTAPQFKLHVIDPGNKGLRAETGSPGGTVASFGGLGNFQIDSPGIFGGRLNVKENGTVILGDCQGCFTNVTDRLVVSGTARIVNLGSGGSTSLCTNGSQQISVCSSSMRYKSHIADWRSGLNLVNRLRPVTFDWKDTGKNDLGLVAEEVAAAEPLLVTRNEKGEVEGVKYDRLSAVFINAFKEQQAQIEQQQAQIKAQEDHIQTQDKALVMLRTRLTSLEQEMRHPRSRQRKAFVSRR